MDLGQVDLDVVVAACADHPGTWVQNHGRYQALGFEVAFTLIFQLQVTPFFDCEVPRKMWSQHLPDLLRRPRWAEEELLLDRRRSCNAVLECTRDSSDAECILRRQKDEDVFEKFWSCKDSFACFSGRIMEDRLDVLTLILWPCQLLLLFCSRMLRLTSCVGGSVSWTAIMGTIRFGRFFAMVTSKNVSWRVRRRGTFLAGTTIAVPIPAMLSRNGKDGRSLSRVEGVVSLSVRQEA